MRGALVACGGERLVPGDLRPRNARAVHALEREGKAAFVGDADRFQRLDFFSFAQRGRDHVASFVQLELESALHSFLPRDVAGSATAIDGFDPRVEFQPRAPTFPERGGPRSPEA